ncbi:hypothetical protein PHMEG_00023019, partial [Phytophthora megakarya]
MEELDEVVGLEPAFGDDDEEREDVDDVSKQAVTASQVTERKTGYRPPMSEDTPAANMVLGRTYEEMMEKSTWIRLFEPKRIRQAFLKSMGLQAQATSTQAVLESWIPAEAGADLWKWKLKLRVGFGVTDIHYPQPPVGKTAGGGVDPSKIPLPKTPSKGYNTVPKSHGMFSKSGDETPYFQDLHVITPKPSGRKERPDHESGRANATRSTIEKASSPEGERLTQKIELATHRPLGQIRAFSGLRKKVRNSMQWLRGFVYEMKGTRASLDEWCMSFQQSLKDETRYYSAKREDKEHLCDYLNRLDGYARNAGIQLGKGGRKARDHVKWFLETWGDHGLERRLCHVKVYDIHELEGMIIEILKVDDRESAKGSSQSRSRSHDTEGLKVLETQKTYTSDEDDRYDIYDDYNDYDNHDGWNADESRYTDEETEESEDSADEDDFVAAGNEVERRNEADGTFARSDARVPKTE